MNPVTKKVEPKQMYCERLGQTVVCGGVYGSLTADDYPCRQRCNHPHESSLC
jgi:hypothetical protein